MAKKPIKKKDTESVYGRGAAKSSGGNESESPETGSAEGSPIVRWILNCRNEAKIAKWNSIMQTRENWDVYWGRQDFSHKLDGQSREVLSMLTMAVEETAAFFQQALVDMGEEWWSCDPRHPQNQSHMKITTDMIKAVTQMQLTKAELLKHVVNGVKSGLLGGLIISKVHGEKYCVPRYVATRDPEKRKAKIDQEMKWAWRLRLDNVSQFNYFPDPTPTNHKMLYEIEDCWTDYHKVCELSQGEDAIYDPDIVEQIEHSMDDDAEEKFDQMRRTNQNAVSHSFRGRVKLTDYWGDILNDENEVIHENVVATIANDRWLIRPPTPNTLWHQTSPFIVAPILDLPDAVWPKGLMDFPSKHNIAATEIYNLMVDGAMKAVNNVGMIRQDWLEDPSQAEGGVKPGTNLNINSKCPPGAKALEMVQTGVVPPDSQQMFNIIQQEFNRSALTSDIRQGMQPKQSVSATQVVETNQTITSVFQGMTKNIEQRWLQKVLEKVWMTCAQYSDLMDEDELRSVLGPDDAEVYLSQTPEERFANTVHGVQFRVNGITLTLQKKMDARSYMTLLQTIGGNEVLMEEFVKEGNSVGKLLQNIIRSIGIDRRTIALDQAEKEMIDKATQEAANNPPPGAGGGQPQPGQGGASPMQGPGAAQPGADQNQMSQVPSPNSGSLADQLGSAAPGVSAKLPHQGFHRGQQ